MYQLMTDKSLQVSLADPEETEIEDFLSGRAQMLYQVARRMVHNTGLHDDVKDAFTRCCRLEIRWAAKCELTGAE